MSCLPGYDLCTRCPFDYCGYFRKGFACVELYGKYNFINTNGQIISDTWFDDCGNFHNGFAIVALNHKWNFINTNGQLLSNTWFDDCGGFDNGFAIVKLDGEYKLINTNGQIVESKGRKNKHIIITEEQEKALKESILLNSFPGDIADAVYKNKTSIGNNPALPNIFEKGYVVTTPNEWDSNVIKQSSDVSGKALEQGFYDASAF